MVFTAAPLRSHGARRERRLRAAFATCVQTAAYRFRHRPVIAVIPDIRSFMIGFSYSPHTEQVLRAAIGKCRTF
jgi:hypothetical protein